MLTLSAACATLVLSDGCGEYGDAPPRIPDAGARDAAFVTEAGPIPTDGGARSDGSPGRDASVPGSDGGGPASCPTTVCDPRTADGCLLEMTCRPVGDGAMCRMLTGSAVAGAPCMSSDDCGPALACFRRGSVGMCARPCCPGASDCRTGERCASGHQLWDGTTSAWGECVTPLSCDVLRPRDGCEPGDGCYIVSSEGATDCRPAGTADEGDPCMEPNDCMPGLFCGGLARRACARICALPKGAGGVACSSGAVCRAYTYSPAGTGICSE